MPTEPAGGVTLSDFWSATSGTTDAGGPLAAGATRVMRPAAGVTQRASVQVVNATGGPLYLRDSDRPPASSIDAKFVLPPRCTGVFPLEAAVLSARWGSTIAPASGDSISFTFTDDTRAPDIYPGVQPSAGGSSPVQSSVMPGGTAPNSFAITTSSGLNIGSVFIYNRSTAQVQLLVGVTVVIVLEPYQWATIPLNVASGGASIQASNGPVGNTLLFLNDCIYVSWADINYAVPFPSGAGSLMSPWEPIYNSQIFNFPASGQIIRAVGVGPGLVTLYTPPQASMYYIHSASVQASGAAAGAGASLTVSRDLSGSGAALTLCSVSLAANQAATQTMEGKGIVARNVGGATPNLVQANLAGAGAVMSATIWLTERV